MNTMTAITTLNPRAMLDLQSKAQARTADILEFATDVETLDWYLKHYTGQRQEAVDEGDASAAIFCEYVLTNLEKALAQ